jgi:hypothetical protein
MVTAALAWIVLAAAPAEASTPVGKALENQSFPWYDAKREKLKPVAGWEPPDWRFRWGPNIRLPGWPGLILRYLLLLVLFGLLIGVLVWAIRTYLPQERALLPRAVGTGATSPAPALPMGLNLNLEDLWGEAERRRASGDFAGAIICLFVHEILTLERLQMIRLAPGRTARQLVRSVSRADIRGHVQATLRLFEPVFYGHRIPTADEFEPVWLEALAFERQLAEGVKA